MQRHRQSFDRLLQRHRLGGFVDAVEEGEVLVHRLGQQIDRLFGNILGDHQQVGLGDGMDILGQAGVAAFGDDVAVPDREGLLDLGQVLVTELQDGDLVGTDVGKRLGHRTGRYPGRNVHPLHLVVLQRAGTGSVAHILEFHLVVVDPQGLHDGLAGDPGPRVALADAEGFAVEVLQIHDVAGLGVVVVDHELLHILPEHTDRAEILAGFALVFSDPLPGHGAEEPLENGEVDLSFVDHVHVFAATRAGNGREGHAVLFGQFEARDGGDPHSDGIVGPSGTGGGDDVLFLLFRLGTCHHARYHQRSQQKPSDKAASSHCLSL